MLIFVGLFIRFVANPLVERLSRAPELLVSFAIGWAALLAALGHYLGFGKELGGLLAGVSLASTPFREAIAARLASLRDFLLLFFFIALGASLDLTVLGASVAAAVVFSLFILIGNPLIVLAIMGAMGYRKRTSFLAGLTVAQISEFSLIFMAMGVADRPCRRRSPGAGHPGRPDHHRRLDLHDHLLPPTLRQAGTAARAVRTAHRPARRNAGQPHGSAYDVIVFGLGRYGSAIAQELRDAGRRVLGVDFNPTAIRHARRRAWRPCSAMQPIRSFWPTSPYKARAGHFRGARARYRRHP